MRWMLAIAGVVMIVTGVTACAAYLIVTGGGAQAFLVSGSGIPQSTHTATPVHTATTTPATTTATSTGTPTRTPMRTQTATPTPTSTPAPCPSRPDAELEFHPDERELDGDGPFQTTIRLENEGKTAATDVLLGLRVDAGSGYIDRVEFANGQVWQILGGGTSTLYLVGTIAGHSAASIPITIYMRPGWLTAHDDPEAKINVEVAVAHCLKHATTSELQIDLEREHESDGDEHEGGHDAIGASTPEADASASVTPTAVDTATPTATFPTIDAETPTPVDASESPAATESG